MFTEGVFQAVTADPSPNPSEGSMFPVAAMAATIGHNHLHLAGEGSTCGKHHSFENGYTGH